MNDHIIRQSGEGMTISVSFSTDYTRWREANRRNSPPPREHTYTKKRTHKKPHTPKIEHQHRETICCSSCGLPYCWHGYCINAECSQYEHCYCEDAFALHKNALHKNDILNMPVIPLAGDCARSNRADGPLVGALRLFARIGVTHMKHKLGVFFKFLSATLLFVFSLSLGYLYFSAIAPASMPWFTPAAMGLTEFGMIGWLFVFTLERHHDAKKTVALIMIFACLLATLTIDCTELAHLIHIEVVITSYVYFVLIAMFAFHFLAFISDFLIGYFAVHPFDSQLYVQPTQQHEHKEIAQPMSLVNEQKMSVQDVEVVRTSRKKKMPKLLGQYFSGQSLTSDHGRDCVCSSCRPELHQVVRTTQKGE